MKFNDEQLAATFKLAVLIVQADGRVDDNETAYVALELVKFGVTPEKGKTLEILANSMDAPKVFEIISNLDYEGKKYVSSFLGTIMAIDGNINEKEVLLWSFVSTTCGLPMMSVADAISNMSKL